MEGFSNEKLYIASLLVCRVVITIDMDMITLNAEHYFDKMSHF